MKESGEFDLYKFTPLPVLVGRHLLQLSGDSDFLAISKDKSRFVEVSAAMLDSVGMLDIPFYVPSPVSQ